MHSLERDEAEFYKCFASLEVIEASYWQMTVDVTIEVLEKDEDYAEYPADQKLLAFYYTYISHIQSSRSRLVEYFPRMKHMMTVMPNKGDRLKGMRHSFKHYVKGVVAEGVKHEIFADRKKLTEQYDRLLWMHFVGVLHFYIKDESPDFQDTDAYIEKSTHFATQAAASGVLESGFDFLRFIAGKDERLEGMSKMISKFIPQ